MGFRGVSLTPSVAVNRRFRAGMHHDSQNSLPNSVLADAKLTQTQFSTAPSSTLEIL